MSAKTDFANLDFLRAYAVLAVYFGHALQTFHTDKIIGRLTIYDLAQTGVLLFFVHTSLVLMLSLERQQAASRHKLFTAFYIRRAFRIYPLSIVTVLIMLAAHIPAFPTDRYSWPGPLAVLSNLALIQNVTRSGSYPAVLWSLPYEVQMYAVLPILFILVRRYTSVWFPIFLWAVDVALILLMWRLNVFWGIPKFLEYTPCFLAGIIGYRLWSAPRLKLHFWGWPIVITLCVALRMLAEATSIPQATTLSKWVACLFLGLSVPQFREVSNRWIRALSLIGAKYSYGIYLSHCTVFWIAFVLLREKPFWIQGLVCLTLSAFIPFVMYHSVEKPMIGVGVRVASAVAKRVGRHGTNTALQFAPPPSSSDR
jgi:peptidoglycan/LPS O-acetylase OafA/YrhL